MRVLLACACCSMPSAFRLTDSLFCAAASSLSMCSILRKTKQVVTPHATQFACRSKDYAKPSKALIDTFSLRAI